MIHFSLLQITRGNRRMIGITFFIMKRKDRRKNELSKKNNLTREKINNKKSIHGFERE